MSKYEKKIEYIQHNSDELGTSIKGSINELIVCAYFLQKGFEVFRNVSPTGKGDIIIWNKKDSPLVIDVKAAHVMEGKTKTILFMNKSKHPNVRTVGVLGGTKVLKDIT